MQFSKISRSINVNADTHLESFPVAGDFRYLCVDPVDESLVALLQQAVRLVQHKEPALPEHN